MRLNSTNPILQFASKDKKLREALSAVVFIGDHLWLASDESTSVERLSTDDGKTFKHHRAFPLDGLIHLPAHETDFDQEIDIEGMDFQDSYLWIVGSHSIKRKNVEKEDSGSIEKKIKKLAKTESDGNRFILARIPLITNSSTGEQELTVSANDPSDSQRVIKAAQLNGDVNSNSLVKAIKEAEQGRGDSHLGNFLSIPGKDNGFDIEGLAVAGDKIFLGLRGPVLRGFTVVLEVSVDFDGPSQLKLRGIGPESRPYKKHFLQLGGLGIRDLCIDGSDVLILAGPTMSLDGPVAVFRWVDAVNTSQEMLVFSDELKNLFRVPNGKGVDHAEGMTLVPESKSPRQVLIVYDSPSEQRIVDQEAVRADVFDLPGL